MSAVESFFALGTPLCPNDIKICYNCEVLGNCLLTDLAVSLVTEEECTMRLADPAVWSVIYNSLDGTCLCSGCEDQILYKEGSIVHRKTCDTDCSDFTLTMSTGTQVSSSSTYDIYLQGLSLESCLSVCLETNSSCMVTFKEGTLDCWVYTSCLDPCPTESGQDSIVYRRACEPKDTNNVALNKSTSMSSLWTDWGEPYIYRSPLGVDGDTTQNKYEDTCFVTDGEVGPWWRVDLGAVFRIHRVVIYNRLDSNSERAHDLVLSVGETETDLVVQYYLPTMFSTYPFTFFSTTVARFVQLEINATFPEYFHLCEVQVFGIPDCGSLLHPENGFVSTTDTTLDHHARYTCNTGYVLSGNSTRKCLQDSSWTGIAPTCEPVECGSLANPTNGTVSLSGSTYTQTALYSCSIGFDLIGSASRICMSDGNWNSSAPSCDPVECGPLSNPSNGTVAFLGSTYMNTATYSCSSGFDLIGSVSSICMSDGNWNSYPPSCNPVECGPLSNPSNGIVSLSGFTYMNTATYSCYTGFSLIGLATRMCMSDGNWSNSAPTCSNLTSVTSTSSALSSASTRSTSSVPQNVTSSLFTLSTPSSLFTTNTTSAMSLSSPTSIYIMPCICYPNKTFTSMTLDEIITKLIAETEIDPKNTTLSKSKLISTVDSRKSSTVMGAVGVCAIGMTCAIIIGLDLITLLIKIKSVCTSNKVVPME